MTTPISKITDKANAFLSHRGVRLRERRRIGTGRAINSFHAFAAASASLN
jgi:hypothetical protein